MDDEQQPAEDPYLVAVRDIVALVREYSRDPDPHRYFSAPEMREIVSRIEAANVAPVLVGLCYDVMSEFARVADRPVDQAVDTFMFALEAGAGLRDLDGPPDGEADGW